ncbi:hypothetical protein [Marivita cryptomonadis]|uniref:hypothetical protein n=1 Tax=Marivita cryptomonadis TaxID=505252 RepID=UPI00391B1D6D
MEDLISKKSTEMFWPTTAKRDPDRKAHNAGIPGMATNSNIASKLDFVASSRVRTTSPKLRFAEIMVTIKDMGIENEARVVQILVSATQPQ